MIFLRCEEERRRKWREKKKKKKKKELWGNESMIGYGAKQHLTAS